MNDVLDTNFFAWSKFLKSLDYPQVFYDFRNQNKFFNFQLAVNAELYSVHVYWHMEPQNLKNRLFFKFKAI